VREKNEFMYISARQFMSLNLSPLSNLNMKWDVNIMSAISHWNKLTWISQVVSLACSLRVSDGSQLSPVNCVTLCVRSLRFFRKRVAFLCILFSLRINSLCPGSQMLAVYSRCCLTKAKRHVSFTFSSEYLPTTRLINPHTLPLNFLQSSD
jgi:hypothetical protein